MVRSGRAASHIHPARPGRGCVSVVQDNPLYLLFPAIAYHFASNAHSVPLHRSLHRTLHPALPPRSTPPHTPSPLSASPALSATSSLSLRLPCPPPGFHLPTTPALRSLSVPCPFFNLRPPSFPSHCQGCCADWEASTRRKVTSTSAGVLFGLAWWILIDAVVVTNTGPYQVPFIFGFYVPGEVCLPGRV